MPPYLCRRTLSLISFKYLILPHHCNNASQTAYVLSELAESWVFGMRFSFLRGCGTGVPCVPGVPGVLGVPGVPDDPGAFSAGGEKSSAPGWPAAGMRSTCGVFPEPGFSDAACFG